MEKDAEEFGIKLGCGPHQLRLTASRQRRKRRERQEDAPRYFSPRRGDPFLAKPPTFDTTPNHLLIEAARGRAPGKALDVGMGQGRNAVYLAKKGWKVTGFDVSKVGLDEARKQAASAGVTINIVQASDMEFDFGANRWDLIAIIYPIEKRSVYRARQALKSGGVVVIECGHKESGQAPYLYNSNELLNIFEGFQILKYEEPLAMHDWAGREMRLVRLIAEKP